MRGAYIGQPVREPTSNESNSIQAFPLLISLFAATPRYPNTNDGMDSMKPVELRYGPNKWTCQHSTRERLKDAGREFAIVHLFWYEFHSPIDLFFGKRPTSL